MSTGLADALFESDIHHEIIFIIRLYNSKKSMSKRAENQIRKRVETSGNPHNIEQLCLDGIQINYITPAIKRLLEGCTNLSYLTMNDCQLKSLQHFPHLKNLIALELSNNKLTGDDLSKLCHCHQISFLMLDHNLITSLTALDELAPLADLEILQIHDNQLCQNNSYRSIIFQMFPKMNIIDYYDRDNNIVDEEENQSEYISSIGNSRLDLLELLNNDLQEQNGPLECRQTEHPDNGVLKRRDSLETVPSPQPMMQNLINNAIIAGPFQRQKEIMLMRTGICEESQSQDEDELMKDFKRKMKKKQQ